MRVARAALLLIVAGLLTAGCLNGAPPAYDPGPDWHGHPDWVYRHTHPFLICTRAHESDRGDKGGFGLHDQGYQAVSPGGTYRGAYQFDRNTWNSVASRWAPHLVGRDPASAWVIDQDLLAWALYQERGNQPWGGRC